MCYDNKEVKVMDNENLDNIPQEEPVYKPRAKWQVWGARIALVLFIALIAMYYLNIARGGL